MAMNRRKIVETEVVFDGDIQARLMEVWLMACHGPGRPDAVLVGDEAFKEYWDLFSAEERYYPHNIETDVDLYLVFEGVPVVYDSALPSTMIVMENIGRRFWNVKNV